MEWFGPCQLNERRREWITAERITIDRGPARACGKDNRWSTAANHVCPESGDPSSTCLAITGLAEFAPERPGHE